MSTDDLQAARDALQAAQDALQAHDDAPFDYRYATDATYRRAAQERARLSSEVDKARRRAVTLAAAAKRAALDTADVQAGDLVNDGAGWHIVLKVNAKTVQVTGPWGSTRLIRRDRLTEHRPTHNTPTN